MPGEITGSPTEARHIARATTGWRLAILN